MIGSPLKYDRNIARPGTCLLGRQPPANLQQHERDEHTVHTCIRVVTLYNVSVSVDLLGQYGTRDAAAWPISAIFKDCGLLRGSKCPKNLAHRGIIVIRGANNPHDPNPRRR